jgi:hypothetical protein
MVFRDGLIGEAIHAARDTLDAAFRDEPREYLPVDPRGR